MPQIRKDVDIPKKDKNAQEYTAIGTQKIAVVREGYEKLIRKYGRHYIRREMGEMMTELIDFPITNNEAHDIMEDLVAAISVQRAVMARLSGSREYYVDRYLLEYMQFDRGMSEKRAKETLQKLDRHEDVKNELYDTLINEVFPVNTRLVVCGYRAEDIWKAQKMSVLGAYNYLVYLRENEKEALENLKAGLPKK